MLKGSAMTWLAAAGAVLAFVAFAPQGTWAVTDQPSPEPPKQPKPRPKPKGKGKQKDSSLNQHQIYSLGYWQAKNGEYGAALATLRSAENQDDPRVQTLTGFALRKLGRVEEAMGYYFRAIAIRPEATTTRQYLGEAFLQMGDLPKAREQLGEIAKRCGVACEDYTLLAKEIAKYERSPPG